METDVGKTKEQLLAELADLREREARCVQAEEALRENEEHFRRFIEESPAALLLIKEGRCFSCNKAAVALFGVSTPQDLIGKRPTDFAPERQPDGRLSSEAAREYLGRALTEGTVSFEWESVRPDSSRIMTEVHLASMNVGGEALIQCVTIDISERKKTESALRLSRSHMEAVSGIGILANSSLDLKEVLSRILDGTLEAAGASVGMIFLRDPETGYLEWGASSGLSDAFVEEYKTHLMKPGEGLTGTIAETGQPIYIAENSSHDPRIARPVVVAENLNTFIGVPVRAGEEIVAVMNILTRPPAVLPEHEISLIAAIGTHVGFAIRNARLFKERAEALEALRQSDERMNLAVINGNVGIWEWKVTSNELEWNDQLKYIFGLPTSTAGLTLAKFMALIHPADLAETERAFRTALEQGTEFHHEYRIVWPDGTVHWIVAIGKGVYDAAGSPIRMLGSALDITERKRAEEQTKALEAQLRQSQKLETIGTLAGGIAHDFNNLLQPIRSCVEILSSHLPSGSHLLDYVKMITHSVDRGSDLVKQLLTFSRKHEIERTAFRLQLLLDETLNLLRVTVPATVEIRKEIDPACCAVMADPINMQQVIMNLCTNACDAMDKHGILSVRLVQTDVDDSASRRMLLAQPGTYVRLSISDTGQGMDEETQKRIFDPFFTTKGVGKGTGLGLSVVHGIVVEHGGAVVVESEPGKGSTFDVYLPCCAEIPEAITEPVEGGLTGGQGNILFLDDEEDIVFLAREMLEYLGYNVTATSRFTEALEEFRQKPEDYDLVISDYSMPGISGVLFAEELQKIRPGIPVLLITGNDQNVPSEKLKDANVCGVLSKPFRMKTLNEAIQLVLNQETDA